MSQTWTIVTFKDEKKDTVEAVPTSWIRGKYCYWPPFHYDKLKAVIRKNEKPNTNWPLYEVTIFCNSTYGKLIIYFFFI